MGGSVRQGNNAIEKIRNCAQLEDKLKKRQAKEKSLATEMTQRMEGMDHAAYSVNSVMQDLQRSSGHLWAYSNVADKRLELRSTRPASELVVDEFQEALESERAELTKAHGQLAEQLRAAQEMHDAVDRAKAEMLAHKLTLHLDRSAWPREFLNKTRDLEEVAMQFCTRTQAVLRSVDTMAEKTRGRTQAAMNRRIAEIHEMRRHLDGEIAETRCAMADAKVDLERLTKKLKVKNAEPEKNLLNEDQDAPGAADLEGYQHRSSMMQSGDVALARVRRAIKSAAYTGHSGRQLDVLFARFDRDGSGQLDEDEVRLALRRTLRIAPSVVADAEISALCNAIDADASGEVSIKELVDFLNSDVDVQALEEQRCRMEDVIEKLNAAMDQLVMDLRCKTAAWKIDKGCHVVTPIKGLELDALPPPLKSGKEPGKRAKPLEPRVLEKVRVKIKQASENAGGRLDELLGRFDADGSGQLEVFELRRALRGPLKIPSFVISDADLLSLMGMLDEDGSGSVSIDEIVQFVGAVDESKGGQAPSQQGSPAKKGTVQLQPIKTVEQGSTGGTRAGGPTSPGKSPGGRGANRWPGA